VDRRTKLTACFSSCGRHEDWFIKTFVLSQAVGPTLSLKHGSSQHEECVNAPPHTHISRAWHHRSRPRFDSAAAIDGFRLGCLFLEAPLVVDVRETVAILSGTNCNVPATNLISRRFIV
jgi:hypothetical protein